MIRAKPDAGHQPQHNHTKRKKEIASSRWYRGNLHGLAARAYAYQPCVRQAASLSLTPSLWLTPSLHGLISQCYLSPQCLYSFSLLMVWGLGLAVRITRWMGWKTSDLWRSFRTSPQVSLSMGCYRRLTRGWAWTEGRRALQARRPFSRGSMRRRPSAIISRGFQIRPCWISFASIRSFFNSSSPG